MFGKKFLSLIGVLLLSNIRLTKASGPEEEGPVAVTTVLKECEQAPSGCASSDPADSYCYIGNQIYSFKGDACTTAAAITISSEAGVKIFDFSSTPAEATVNASTGEISNLNGLVLFNCVGSGSVTCKRTYGYVKTGTGTNKYYRIGADGTNEEIVSGEAVNTVGALDPDSFKLNVGGGVGFISDTVKNYLLELDNTSVFLSSEEKTAASGDDKSHIVIKAVSNTFVFDNAFNDEQFCVLTSSSVMSRIDNFCSGSSFDSLYNCEGGLCKLKESYVEAGTYIVGTDLYVCTGETGSVVCTKDDGSNNGINVFKKYTDDNGDTLVQLTANLTTVSLGGADKYQIFDCKSAMCTRTSGYIKYGSDNSSTGKCASDTDCADQAAADATGFTGNAGTLTFTGSGFTYTVTGATGPSTLTSGNDYFFVYDTNSKYDYLSFKNANIVAIAKNVGTEVYITSSTNVVGNDAENCNSNTYYKYVIADADAGTINKTSSAQCENQTNPCPLSDNTTTNAGNCPNGYYLKATDDSALANAAEAGTIYKCVDQSCKALDGSTGYEFVYGIVPNADAINKATVPYIVCAGTTTCKTVAVTAGSDCSSATQGQIISPSGGVYALCVVGSSATGGVTITTSNESNYILPMTVFNSADTSGKYVMVSFDGTNVTKDVSNTNKYNYTGADNKIYSKKDNSRICAEKVYEYTKDEAQFEYTLTDEKPKSG